MKLMNKLITSIPLFLFSCAAFAVEAAAQDPATQWGGKWAGLIFMVFIMVSVAATFLYLVLRKDSHSKK